jgi:myo-inositol 2-dehydrogenase/D-chiro-inositol 1-dehydrogenase
VTASVNIAVIGLGFMGSRWARAISEHDGSKLRVVSDVKEDLGEESAARYDATFVRDPLEAAAHPDVAGVVVCTPENLHLAPALAALDAGKVTCIEKPIAHTVQAAEQIRDMATSKGVPLLVGHILRFEPRYAAIQRAIEEGRIGTVQAIQSERIGKLADQRVLGGRTTIPLYYGVHEFDLARWYGGAIVKVSAERSRGVLEQHGFDVFDLYSATVRFASGAHGTIMLGWSLPDSTPGWGQSGFTVIGETGLLQVDQGSVGLLMVGRDGLIDEDAFYSPIVHNRYAGALAIEVDHFVRCVRGQAEPLCTADDGTEAVRISLAMEAAAASGQPATLKMNPSEARA